MDESQIQAARQALLRQAQMNELTQQREARAAEPNRIARNVHSTPIFRPSGAYAWGDREPDADILRPQRVSRQQPPSIWDNIYSLIEGLQRRAGDPRVTGRDILQGLSLDDFPGERAKQQELIKAQNERQSYVTTRR